MATLYKCTQPNCPGHDSFAATCLTTVKQVQDYPVLTQFQHGWYLEEEAETEPVSVKPFHDDPCAGQKSGGRATQEMKRYNNKGDFNPTAKPKQKVR